MPLAKQVAAILDDEPEMRKALSRLLSVCGFQVEEFESGKDLLTALETRSFDYLLLDLHMPGLDGFGVLEACRARGFSLPVIVITAHDEPGSSERAFALGCSAYLKKPVEKQALLTAMQAANSTLGDTLETKNS